MSKETTKPKKSKNTALIVKVSLFWITLACVVTAFVLWGQVQYNRGIDSVLSRATVTIQK